MDKLTQQQENFCKAYIKTGIGYKAYIEAYPKAKNWERASVDTASTRLLNNAKISHRIEELNNEIKSTLQTSLTLNKRKILEEIIELQQNCKESRNGQNAINLQALKLLSQIAGLLTENQTNINVNINNNQIINDVSNYLNL